MREATLNTKKATPLPISQYSPPLNRQSSRRRLLRSAKRPFRFRQLSASQHMFSLSTLHHRMQIPRLGTMTHRPEQHTRSRKRRRQNAQLSRFVAPHVGATPSQPGSREAGKPGRIVDFFTAAGMHPKDWTSNHILDRPLVCTVSILCRPFILLDGM